MTGWLLQEAGMCLPVSSGHCLLHLNIFRQHAVEYFYMGLPEIWLQKSRENEECWHLTFLLN